MDDKHAGTIDREEAEYRATIAKRILYVGLGIGTALILPTALLALHDGDRSLLAFDASAYIGFLTLALVTLAFVRRLPRRMLNISLVGLGAALGSFLLFHYRSGGVGDAWLLTATVLATLFFGGRGGLVACLFLGLAYAIRLAAGSLGLLPWHIDIAASALHAMNVIGLAALSSFAISRLFEWLRGTIRKQGSLAMQLRHRQLDLERLNHERVEAERKAEYLENHDRLTSLPNRGSFRRELERAIAAAQRNGQLAAVMAIGLDRFRRITEVRGSTAADAVATEAAARLSRCFRFGDVVGRAGDDSFFVFFPDIKSQRDITTIIEQGRGAFDRSFSTAGVDIAVSASFGMALYPDDGRTADDLMRSAEAALHIAMEDGFGSYRLFDAKMYARLLARLSVEQEIDGALRAGAFEPWFQPKVDCLGRIVGVEALARWNLASGGVRQPNDFIEIAERSGRIDGIGKMVLHKACSCAAGWASSGLRPVAVSVNLAPAQFRGKNIVGEVRDIILDTGIEPSRLELELTESGLMGDENDTIEKLAGLKAMGVSVSIDDFGTGYSSFSMLKNFPVDTVKLPKSFVDPLPGDIRASMVAEAIIDLAHNLHFSVVAEGVETLDQFSWLDRAMCDQYQGFLFSPPLSPRAFERVLARGLPAIVQ